MAGRVQRPTLHGSPDLYLRQAALSYHQATLQAASCVVCMHYMPSQSTTTQTVGPTQSVFDISQVASCSPSVSKHYIIWTPLYFAAQLVRIILYSVDTTHDARHNGTAVLGLFKDMYGETAAGKPTTYVTEPHIPRRYKIDFVHFLICCSE